MSPDTGPRGAAPEAEPVGQSEFQKIQAQIEEISKKKPADVSVEENIKLNELRDQRDVLGRQAKTAEVFKLLNIDLDDQIRSALNSANPSGALNEIARRAATIEQDAIATDSAGADFDQSRFGGMIDHYVRRAAGQALNEYRRTRDASINPLGRSDWEWQYDATKFGPAAPAGAGAAGGAPAGGGGVGGGGGPAAGVESGFYIPPDIKEANIKIEQYKNASEAEQRTFFREWMLLAREELDKESASKDMGDLLKEKGSMVYVVDEARKMTINAEAKMEQQAAWNALVAKGEIFGATDPKEAAKAAGKIRGKEDLNTLFQRTAIDGAGGAHADITAANAFETIDAVAAEKMTLDEIYKKGLENFKTSYGDTKDAEYIYAIGFDLFIVDGRHSVYGIKSPMGFLNKVTRLDSEAAGAKNASKFALSQIKDKMPALTADYFGAIFFEPKEHFRDVAPVKPKDLVDKKITAAMLKGQDFDTTRTPAELEKKITPMAVYYINEINKAAVITAGKEGTEVIQQYVNNPTKALEGIQSAIEGNNFLQELSAEQRSSFVRVLIEIALDHYRVPNPGEEMNSETHESYSDYGKSRMWNEAKKAGVTEQDLQIKYPKMETQLQFAHFIAYYASILSNDDKEELRQEYYPNLDLAKRINKGETYLKILLGGLGAEAVEGLKAAAKSGGK